jgi:alpha-beta hydrolase superfamily lysophospholipase
LLPSALPSTSGRVVERKRGRNVTDPEMTTVVDDDGTRIFVYHWPVNGAARAAVHMLHGLGEHSRRYDRVAAALNAAGYTVYADDHRASA